MYLNKWHILLPQKKKKLILPKKLSYFCVKLGIVDVFTVCSI